MNTKTNSHHNNRRPTIAFLNKFLVLYVLVLVAFLSSCATTAPNIKSVDDVKGHKLLVGRFVFYVNEKLIEPHEAVKFDTPYSRRERKRETETDEEYKEFITGFTIFLDNGETKKLVLDEKGYVYIPVDEGQYYIKRIQHHSALFGTYSFPIGSSSGISINSSDAAVNFGTIKVEFRRSATSKTAGVLTLIASYGILSISPGELRVTQTSDWDVPRHYISSKFSIPPELIRDEVVSLSVTTRRAIAKLNDEINKRKEEYQYSSHDWYSKGLSAFIAENYPTVISCMSKAIELGQGDTGAYYFYRGRAFFKLNQFEKAIEDFSKAVELDPENAGFCMTLILTNIIAGNYEGVLDNIKKTSFLPLGIKDKAILIYLECIAKKLLNKDTIQCEEELNKILKNKFTIKSSFDEIESWLENANIDDDKKSFIKKKTKLIEKHKKWY